MNMVLGYGLLLAGCVGCLYVSVSFAKRAADKNKDTPIY